MWCYIVYFIYFFEKFFYLKVLERDSGLPTAGPQMGTAARAETGQNLESGALSKSST